MPVRVGSPARLHEGVLMYAEERQHEIVTRAREMGRVAVAELAARYDVTAETIRRDLTALENVMMPLRIAVLCPLLDR